MKKLLPILFLLVGSAANAQISKGSLLLGGAFSYSHSVSRNEGPDNNAKRTDWLVSPSIGKAVSTNTILGAGFNVSQSKSGNPFTESATHGWSVNTYLRNYLPIGNNFNLFAQTAAFYGESRTNYSGPTSHGHTHDRMVGLHFMPGLDYAASKRFHLEIGWNDLLTVNYSKQTASNSSGSDITQKNLSAYTNTSSTDPLTIGFVFLFAK